MHNKQPQYLFRRVRCLDASFVDPLCKGTMSQCTCSGYRQIIIWPGNDHSADSPRRRAKIVRTIYNTQSITSSDRRCHFSLFLQCCFTSTETGRTIRDGESRTSTSTSTETGRTIRDGESRTSTSTSTAVSYTHLTLPTKIGV